MTSSRIEKQALVARVVRRSGNSALTVEKLVDATFEAIYQSLRRGERASLRNFGTFYVRPERQSWVFKFNPAPARCHSGCPGGDKAFAIADDQGTGE